MRIYAVIFLFVILASPVFAGTEVEKSRYDDVMRGWWWYEPEPPKQDEKEKNPVEKKNEKQGRVLPSLKEYSTEQLWNMHPDDFQPLVKDFLKKAVQYPTLENVRDFYVMVDISRMKAHVFQNVAGAVWQQYPEFSLNADLPTSAAGRMAKVRMQKGEVRSKILDGAHEFALIYFYSEKCEFCKAQDKIMNSFVKEYGWEIKRLEINENPELAARFDVKITPYLLLIYRDSKDYFPVSIGVSSREEIEERLYRGMRLLSGEISPESYTMFDFQRGGKMDPSGYIQGDSETQQ